VWVPEGQVLVLDIDTPVLAMLLLVEGKLYFDTTRNISRFIYESPSPQSFFSIYLKHPLKLSLSFMLHMLPPWDSP